MYSQRRQWHPTPVLLPGKSHGQRSLVAAVHGVARSRTRLSDFTFTFHFHALEKEMATHSSVLAWRIPGTGESGGLPSMGLHRVGHDWSDLAAAEASARSSFSTTCLCETGSSSCTSTRKIYCVQGNEKHIWRPSCLLLSSDIKNICKKCNVMHLITLIFSLKNIILWNYVTCINIEKFIAVILSELITI